METDETACVSGSITGVQNVTGKIESVKTLQQGPDESPNPDDDAITDLNAAREALNICLQQLLRVQRFLNDDSCWWKMLKERDPKCCGQKVPHLHGLLDGAPVTLKLVEDPEIQGPVVVQPPLSTDSEPPEKMRKVDETDDQQIAAAFVDPDAKDSSTAASRSCTSLDCMAKQMTAMETVDETAFLNATCATMEPSDDPKDCGSDDECKMKCVSERKKLGIIPPKSDRKIAKSSERSRTEKEETLLSNVSMNLSDEML